ncbi:biotin transporter BioY (plasmid) [Sulfitobacter faviae]|uniref:Biotin transporter n=1 Tax=Sulfitobacter faviae TaxID=1775881 RepID=A0ABZ0V812_9RHOB|nr:biotin transporter BioY [Sulfitobacter faviae]WPZ23530.1 biotin transporter BioY [Sulfitobacter faviae]
MSLLSLQRSHLHLTWHTIALTILGATAITISAKVQIPFWPVPMTLHTFAIFLLSALLGPRLGVAAMLTYLGTGAMGLPVFSGSPERGIGLAYLAGPTGGYLFGYLVASGLVGWLAKGLGWLGCLTVMFAALGVVYVAGLAWLALYVPNSMLLAAGLTPFLLGDLLKVALAATAVSGANQFKGSLK